MVGRTVDELFPKVPHQPGDRLLELDGLTGRRMPRDVSLTLRRGEILGIAGLVGAGRTELLRCLFSLDPVRRGEVRVAGIAPPASPRGRIRAGLGLVSEDRKGEGLAQTRSIADNITYSRLQPYSRFGWLRTSAQKRGALRWMDRLEVKARSPDQEVQALSGGNQQKVALARLLHQEADVLLLDEPTRGIDAADDRAAVGVVGAELALDIERYLIAYTRKRNEHGHRYAPCDHSELDAWAMKYGLAEYTAKV
jgi:ribose transport system ATP-binding protein